jgi:hypothetical protein
MFGSTGVEMTRILVTALGIAKGLSQDKVPGKKQNAPFMELRTRCCSVWETGTVPGCTFSKGPGARLTRVSPSEGRGSGNSRMG